MSQISKKFIQDNAIDGSKIRISNNEAVRVRNAADNADVEALKLDTNDKLILGKLPLGPNSNAPTEDAQLTNKKYVDEQIQAKVAGIEWQDSCLSVELDSASILSPSAGERFLIAGVGAGDFLGHDNAIAEYTGSAYSFTSAKLGMYVSVDDELEGVYYFGGSSWTRKDFESTTASTGLEKVGKDIRIAATTAGDGLSFNLGILSVNPDGVTLENSADAVQIKDGGVSNAKLAGGITDNKLSSDYVQTSEVDGSTIEFSGSQLKVKDLGISTAKIADDGVDKSKIAADVAGIGLVQNVDGSLEVKVDETTITILTDTLQVKDLGITNAKLAGSISDDKLASDFVKTSEVDNSSIEFVTDTLRVKAAGITEAMLNSAIDAETLKVATGYSATPGVVAVGDTVQLAISKLDGNIQNATLTPTKEVLVLTGTSITNGYVDLTNEAVSGSLVVGVVGGPLQVEGSSYDYTLTVESGKTRITFQNDLASGGDAALIAGDVLSVNYMR